jgi:colicin import membrane protein
MNVDSRGLVGTVTFHGVVLLIFLLASFKASLPLPADEGLLVNFGDVEFAGGKKEPKYNDIISKKAESRPVEKHVEKTQHEKQLITQDVEEAPVIAPKDKIVKKQPVKKTEVIKTPAPVTKKTDNREEETKPVKPSVNTSALYRGRKTNTNYTGSEGNSTGEGNMGVLTGSENSTNRGLGSGTGNGTTFNLDGRNSLALPKPESNLHKEGRVVVEIKVDRAGNIISAVAGVKGSTTLDSELLAAAKKAALSSKFDSKPDAAFTQVGTITYIFKF